VNGLPVADASFVAAFWEVWDALHVSYAAENVAAAEAAAQGVCAVADLVLYERAFCWEIKGISC
jgi:hypothetical protein